MTSKRKRQQNIWTGIALIAGLVLVCAVLLLLYRNHQSQLRSEERTASSERVYRSLEVDGVKYTYNTDLITMMALGVDIHEGEERGQADAVYLVVFDRGEEKISIVSLSRDAMVPIRMFDAGGKDLGWNSQHLALAYSFGSSPERGCLLMAEAVSKLFNGVPMVYYTAANLSMISDIQYLVGDLEVTVPDDSLEYLGEQYQEGNQVTLTTENVEEFVRSRNTEQDFSNEGRMNRQKAYIEAYLTKLKQLLEEDFDGTLDKLTRLLSQTSSNIDLTEASDFANMVLSYSFSSDDYYVLEGENRSGRFHDEFVVDEDALKQLVLKIFYKEEK